MSDLRPSNHPAEALEAPPAARTYPALLGLIEQAELRILAAADDSQWITHYLIWLELHRLAYGPESPAELHTIRA